MQSIKKIIKNVLLEYNKFDIDEIIVSLNDISSNKTLSNIEKKVKIAETLSGQYIGKNGNITVYRSPNNITLLAVKGDFNNEKIFTIDLNPRQVLTVIQKING